MLASQPSWCGWSWRHTVKRDSDTSDPPKASQIHGPTIYKECGPQERASRHPTLPSPVSGSPAQATLWSGNAIVKEECDSVATLASHRTMLGQHKCLLSPCDPTSWGHTSPHEGPLPLKQVHLSFVPLKSQLGCESLPHAPRNSLLASRPCLKYWGSQGQPQATATSPAIPRAFPLFTSPSSPATATKPCRALS